jgi:hypothetical protein
MYMRVIDTTRTTLAQRPLRASEASLLHSGIASRASKILLKSLLIILFYIHRK